jgi:phosphatidylethanolamine/phosphatidyl-N-methylethanolamine N-methyltransferase
MDAERMYSESYHPLINQGMVGYVSKLAHMTLEFGAKKHCHLVLELGAGQGQHLQYVQHSYDIYLESDVRLDNLISGANLDSERGSGVSRSSVRQVRLDAENLESVANCSVDRVVATCLIAHLANPEKALLEIRRVLKVGGRASIYIPSEPGLILRLARSLSTVPKAKRLGYDHLKVHYKEHRNHFLYLKVLIEEAFSGDHVYWKTYPLGGTSWNLSLWKIVHLTKISE